MYHFKSKKTVSKTKWFVRKFYIAISVKRILARTIFLGSYVWYLKLVPAIFYQVFIFSSNDSPSETMKCAFYFTWKDIPSVVLLSFPLFLPVSHCFRGWLKINRKVHDVINCLNKSLITHFVWYLEKEQRYDIETLSIDGVSDKERFYRKIMQKIGCKS